MKNAILGVLWGTIVIAGLAAFQGPSIEARVLPVLDRVEVLDVKRGPDGRLHWNMEVCKARELRFIAAEYDLLRPATGRRVAVTDVRSESLDAQVGATRRTYAPGCRVLGFSAGLPAGTRSGDVVTGTVWYDGALWPVPQPFGTIRIP